MAKRKPKSQDAQASPRVQPGSGAGAQPANQEVPATQVTSQSSTAGGNGGENGRKSPNWQLIIAFVTAVLVVLFVMFLVIVDVLLGRSMNPISAVLVVVLLSVSAAVFAGTFTGFLLVDWTRTVGKDNKLKIQAGAGFAVFVIVFFFTPRFFPTALPGPFPNATIPIKSPSRSLDIITPEGSVEEKRRIKQAQDWKTWANQTLVLSGQMIVLRADFPRSYQPIRTRIMLAKNGQSLNDVVTLCKGIAFVVGENDFILHQLVFDVQNAGNVDATGATNPNNDNELLIDGVGPGRSLLAVVTISFRRKEGETESDERRRRTEFDAAFATAVTRDELRQAIHLKNLDKN